MSKLGQNVQVITDPSTGASIAFISTDMSLIPAGACFEFLRQRINETSFCGDCAARFNRPSLENVPRCPHCGRHRFPEKSK